MDTAGHEGGRGEEDLTVAHGAGPTDVDVLPLQAHRRRCVYGLLKRKVLYHLPCNVKPPGIALRPRPSSHEARPNLLRSIRCREDKLHHSQRFSLPSSLFASFTSALHFFFEAVTQRRRRSRAERGMCKEYDSGVEGVHFFWKIRIVSCAHGRGC